LIQPNGLFGNAIRLQTLIETGVEGLLVKYGLLTSERKMDFFRH